MDVSSFGGDAVVRDFGGAQNDALSTTNVPTYRAEAREHLAEQSLNVEGSESTIVLTSDLENTWVVDQGCCVSNAVEVVMSWKMVCPSVAWPVWSEEHSAATNMFVIVAAAKFLRHISFFSSTVPREAVRGMVSYRTVTEHNVPARKLAVGDWDRCSTHTIQSFPACFARGILMFLVHVEEKLRLATCTTHHASQRSTADMYFFTCSRCDDTRSPVHQRSGAKVQPGLSMRPLALQQPLLGFEFHHPAFLLHK